MKTAPTDIDREAAAFFELAAGLRVFAGGRWARILSDDGQEGGVAMTENLPPLDDRRNALDTDDAATVGVMLAQVAAARPNQAVSVVDRRYLLPGETERRFMVLMESNDTHTTATGSTLGVALVAAMKGVRK